MSLVVKDVASTSDIIEGLVKIETSRYAEVKALYYGICGRERGVVKLTDFERGLTPLSYEGGRALLTCNIVCDVLRHVPYPSFQAATVGVQILLIRGSLDDGLV